MIANITKGSDFGGLARYLFQSCDQSGEVRPEVVFLGGTIPGKDPASLAEGMDAIASLRRSVTKPVRHWMLRFAPEDVGKYDHSKMLEIGNRFACEMGASAYAIMSHGDHIHLMANSVTHDGNYISDTWDFAKAQTVVRGIERDFGLRVLRSTHEVEPGIDGGKPRVVTVAPPDESRPKQGELNAAVGGSASNRLTLQSFVSEASKGNPSLTEFIERLEVFGVEPRVMVNKTGWTGISFSYQGMAFKGQDLGNKFKAKELQKTGVNYVENRDGEAVERCRRRAASSINASAVGPVERPAQTDSALAGEIGQSPNRDARADGASNRAIGGGASSFNGSDEVVLGAGDRRDGRDDEPSGGREPNRGGEHQRDGGERENSGTIAGTSLGADGGAHSWQPGEAGERKPTVEESVTLIHRLVAGDGAYGRVLGLASAELLAESEGSDVDAKSLQQRNRASLRHVAMGAFSAIAGNKIRQQVQAMGVERFEVGILPPKDRDDLKPMPLRVWSAQEMVEPKRVAYLAAMNTKGYDIYVRPSREQGTNKGIVLLDDLDAAKVAALTADGFQPSMVVETSPGNLQAWVRVADHDLSAEEGTAVSKALANRFGADPGSADWCHFGRLAPFANRKAKHADPVTRQGPLTDLKHAVAVVAHRGADLVARIRQWLAERAAIDQVEQASKAQEASRAHAAWQRLDAAERSSATPGEAFLAFRGAVTTARPGDESARDYGAALRMFAAGYDAHQVSQAMRDHSPDLDGRKGRGADNYVERTVDHAETEAHKRGWKVG